MRDQRSVYLKKKFSTWIILTLIFVLLIYWLYPSPPKIIRTNLPLVHTETVKEKDLAIYLDALGTVTPINTINITTQINGLLKKVLFKEGEFVQKDQVLMEIDDRLLQAQLVQYQGQLKRDLALLENAQLDLNRYKKLWHEDSISEQTLATQTALVKEYLGTIDIDQGLISSTQINIDYCQIKAPIDGRMGLRQIDAGNYITNTNSQIMGVLTALDPITVIFSIAEDHIPQLLPLISAHESIPVDLYDRQNQNKIASGELISMDNLIAKETGTVNLKARFSNAAGHLFPNQFVNVKILVKKLTAAVLVPNAALQYKNGEVYTYLLSKDQSVHIQYLKIDQSIGDESIVLSGLNPGDQVITEGTDKLTDHMKVSVL